MPTSLTIFQNLFSFRGSLDDGNDQLDIEPKVHGHKSQNHIVLITAESDMESFWVTFVTTRRRKCYSFTLYIQI